MGREVRGGGGSFENGSLGGTGSWGVALRGSRPVDSFAAARVGLSFAIMGRCRCLFEVRVVILGLHRSLGGNHSCGMLGVMQVLAQTICNGICRHQIHQANLNKLLHLISKTYRDGNGSDWIRMAWAYHHPLECPQVHRQLSQYLTA